jgi:hypothetical protein
VCKRSACRDSRSSLLSVSATPPSLISILLRDLLRKTLGRTQEFPDKAREKGDVGKPEKPRGGGIRGPAETQESCPGYPKRTGMRLGGKLYGVEEFDLHGNVDLGQETDGRRTADPLDTDCKESLAGRIRPRSRGEIEIR